MLNGTLRDVTERKVFFKEEQKDVLQVKRTIDLNTLCSALYILPHLHFNHMPSILPYPPILEPFPLYRGECVWSWVTHGEKITGNTYLAYTKKSVSVKSSKYLWSVFYKRNVNRASWLRLAAATHCVETFHLIIFLFDRCTQNTPAAHRAPKYMNLTNDYALHQPCVINYEFYIDTHFQVMFYDDEQKSVVVSKSVGAAAAMASNTELKAKAVSRGFPGGEKGRRDSFMASQLILL